MAHIRFLGIRAWAAAIGLTCLLALTNTAQAQSGSWPTKPIRLVVAFPPGGLADVLARSLQAHLSEAFGQPVVIDNRGGAGGNVAGAEVARNGGDGHTFLVTVSTTESVNPSIFNRMPFDPQKDLQPVALLANSQLFLVTRPTLSPNTLKEFVAYAKANPGKLSYGSAGNGTTPHLAGELLKQGARIFATHIPYRGAAPAIQDVMAGQVDFAFAPGTMISMAKAGKLKVLGVASHKRSSAVPDVPTLSEAGVDGVFADTLFGIYAPSAMPGAIVIRMNREINRVLALPEIKSRFVDVGAEAIPMKPAEYKTTVQAETRLFGDVVKSRGIKAD